MALPRKTRQKSQLDLIDAPPSWREHWWGMPEYHMGDATPQRRITINFMTNEDVAEFARVTGIHVRPSSDSALFPEQKVDEPKEWAYVED